MGERYFEGLRESVYDAGFGDGIEGRVGDHVAQLPSDSLYWLAGENPGSYGAYAEFRDGRVVIDVRNEDAGLPSLGVNLPQGAVKDTAKSTDLSTILDYNGVTYEVVHKTVPLEEL